MLHMEQNNYIRDYRYEIIDILLNGNSHARAIAKRLDVNHMIIVRKLKELLEENVVDYRVEGKNKSYFLKKGIEAKTYILKTEHYKFLKILKKYPILIHIFEKIKNNKKIKLAVLFGSYAKKSAGKKSDIDIYIETMDKAFEKEIESINSKLSVKIGEFDLDSFLVKEIIKNHVIIKGVEEFYERIF